MRAAVEAKRIAREALDHKRERFKLEMTKIWDRYDQDRDVELECEDKAFRDAEAKVKGLEGDHRNYKLRKAAAEAQLNKHTPTGSPNTGQPPGGGRPSAASASSVLLGDSKDDPPHRQKIGAEFTDFRKLRESYPNMSIQEFTDFKFYFDAKQAAAKRRDGMDRPGRGRPSPESARSEGSPRNVTYDRNRAERHHRRRDDF